MMELVLYLGAKYLVYLAFFTVLAALLHSPDKWVLPLKSAFHRLWLGIVSTLPVILVVLLFHPGNLATGSIWVFRACAWALAFSLPFAPLKPSWITKGLVIAAGLAINLGFDLALEALEPSGRGGRFAPSLGWWEFGLC